MGILSTTSAHRARAAGKTDRPTGERRLGKSLIETKFLVPWLLGFLEVILSWSGGKDSTLALRALISRGVRVKALVTTLSEGYNRVSMHGVRRELLRDQASSVGLQLEEVWIPKNSSNEIYEERMRAVLEKYAARGVRRVAFGDLFLEDIRRYREQRLAELAMRGTFPLWHKDTRRLASKFIELGFKAITCCVDSEKLPSKFCGIPYDQEFLSNLPKWVDPCGENGEFHTFVYEGPLFRKRVTFEVGRVVKRKRFYFADFFVPKSA
jgi:uncharacterized protein (TIGR00290 family)